MVKQESFNVFSPKIQGISEGMFLKEYKQMWEEILKAFIQKRICEQHKPAVNKLSWSWRPRKPNHKPVVIETWLIPKIPFAHNSYHQITLSHMSQRLLIQTTVPETGQEYNQCLQNVKQNDFPFRNPPCQTINYILEYTRFFRYGRSHNFTFHAYFYLICSPSHTHF